MPRSCNSLAVAVALVTAACGRIAFDELDQDDTPGVITLAGGSMSGMQDGAGAAALFNNPVNVAVAPDGKIYVSDHGNSAIRLVTSAGAVSTLVAAHPELRAPFGLAFTASGELLVGTDYGRILQIDVVTAAVTVHPLSASGVRGLVVLADGRIAFTNWMNDRLEILEPDGTATLLAGNGTEGFQDGVGATAQFANPVDIVRRPDNGLLVGDLSNFRIRLLNVDGSVITYAGGGAGRLDGDLQTAQFSGPGGLAQAPDGTLYVADRFNNVIRRIAPNGTVTTIAGSGTSGFADSPDPLEASFYGLEGIDLSPDARFLYIADGNAGQQGVEFHRIRRLTL